MAVKHQHVESSKPIKSKNDKPEKAAPAAPIVMKAAPVKINKDKPEALKSRQKAEPEWSIPKAEYIKVRVDTIDDTGYNARQQIDEQSESFVELCQSVQSMGVIEPIIVTPIDDPKKNKQGLRFDLVAGFRRFRALKKVGSRETFVVCHHYTHPAQRVIVNLLENKHREDLRAYEEACAFKRLKEEGFRTATIAEKLAISETKINNYVSCVENLIPELLDVFKKNGEQTTLSMLIQLSRADENEQKSYYRALTMAPKEDVKDKPKEEKERKPKVKNYDQLRAFNGDLYRSEEILVNGAGVEMTEELRQALSVAIRWAAGEIKSYPLVLAPEDRSDLQGGY